MSELVLEEVAREEQPSLYLTRLQLHEGRRETRFLLASRQRLHAAVMKSFPLVENSEQERILWMIEEGQHKTFLLILSPVKPELTYLVEQCGYPQAVEATTRTVDLGPLLASLAVGQRYRFRSTLNCVKRQTKDGRTREFKLLSEGAKVEWLLQKAPAWGFTVEEKSLALLRQGRAEFAHPQQTKEGRGRQVKGQVALELGVFEGLLTVTDVALFREALRGGLGRGKAFGCGLLLLAAAE